MRILHTMLRVTDMSASIAFYTQVLGMRLLRELRQSEARYSLAFLGYAEESGSSVLELTYNDGVDQYQKGNAFGHVAIEVDNCHLICQRLEKAGVTIDLLPKPLAGTNEIIAFIRDPDGYQIELIQRPR